MTVGRRVGILGGTFDPIHCGHLDLGRAAQHALELTELHVLPANKPVHRSGPVASAAHRFAMAALAVQGRSGWRASDLELLRDEPSFTTDTLARLHAEGYRPDELFFIVGADAFMDVQSWKNFPAVLEAAHFAVVSRPGYPAADLAHRLTPRLSIFLIEANTADVSSTAIRARLAAGQSITGLVDPRDEQHIEQHGLYRQGRPRRD